MKLLESFHIAFINHYKPFLILFIKLYNAFYKAFIIKPFQILSPVLISIFHEDTIHENTIETSLTLEKCRQAKFCMVDAWNQVLLFTGETSFSSRFFFNIPEISTQIQKPTKYQSTTTANYVSKKFYTFNLQFHNFYSCIMNFIFFHL